MNTDIFFDAAPESAGHGNGSHAKSARVRGFAAAKGMTFSHSSQHLYYAIYNVANADYIGVSDTGKFWCQHSAMKPKADATASTKALEAEGAKLAENTDNKLVRIAFAKGHFLGKTEDEKRAEIIARFAEKRGEIIAALAAQNEKQTAPAPQETATQETAPQESKARKARKARK